MKYICVCLFTKEKHGIQKIIGITELKAKICFCINCISLHNVQQNHNTSRRKTEDLDNLLITKEP